MSGAPTGRRRPRIPTGSDTRLERHGRNNIRSGRCSQKMLRIPGETAWDR
jgi:hypothetical protein